MHVTNTQNPYNMTKVEKERLKEKNRLLIAQFQTKSGGTNSEDFSMQSHPYLLGYYGK